MKASSTLIIMCTLCIGLYAQSEHMDSIFSHHPDDILLDGVHRPSICFVGTFHFGYPNLDAHKTAETDQVNVRLPHRQKELHELIEYIKKFNPTKIAVEAGRNTGYLLHDRTEIAEGISERKSGEIHQLAFRLLDQLSLDTLYGVDAGSIVSTLTDGPYKDCINPYIDTLFKDWDFKSDSEWDKRYSIYYNHQDKMALKHTLLDYFKWMNWSENIKRYKGAYFSGDFKNNGHDGADALAMYWYARTFRIARNIQNITESPDDRILVLIGAGHVGILQDIFGDSPEYELIHFNDLGK